MLRRLHLATTVGRGLIGLVVAMLSAGPALADDTTGITDTTIKIGMFSPLTGPSAAWGYPINHAAMMVYLEANDKGGINGRKFEIIQEDDACDVAKAMAAVKKLIYQDKVFMIHGGVCSLPVIAARD